MGVEAGEGPTLEIVVPYLAATYDERMFEELYRRAQLFEVTLGGEMRVEGRVDPERFISEHRRREKLGNEPMTKILVMKPRRAEQWIFRQT